MGYSQKRNGRSGNPRYTRLLQDLRGERPLGRDLLQQEGRGQGMAAARSRGWPRAAWATRAVAARPSAATSPRSGCPTT